MDPLAPALQEADRPFIVPAVDSPAFVPALIDVCRRERVHLVFPLIDPDIPVLAKHRADIESVGARVLAVSEEAAALTADKAATHAFFVKHGIPTPRTWLAGELDSDGISFPLFIKPRRGNSARCTYRVQNLRELRFFLEYVPDPVVQEYLPGPEITNDVVCDAEGEVLAVISRERIEVRWGEVAKARTVYDPFVTSCCLKIARALKAIGPITVQCMLRDAKPCFTEINARFAGGVPLAIAAGARIPQYLLARAAGVAVDIPPIGQYQVGLYLTRFDDAWFVTEQELCRTPRRGVGLRPRTPCRARRS
jgi:carbamoyl-phosphate synthase large subunit